MERTRATFITLQKRNHYYSFLIEKKHNVGTQAHCVTSLCTFLGFRTEHKLLKQIPLPFSSRKADVTCLIVPAFILIDLVCSRLTLYNRNNSVYRSYSTRVSHNSKFRIFELLV